MPDRNKNRLAPLTIKPPKLRKYAAQSREKRRLCRQKPAAAAQCSAPHPHPRPCKHPSTTAKKSALQGIIRRPARQKKLALKQQNAENASVSTEIYSAARRNVAIQLTPLPTKIRQPERILCLLQEKCGHPRQKSRHTKLRRAATKQPHSARHSSQVLDPDRLPTQSFCPHYVRKPPVLRHKSDKT